MTFHNNINTVTSQTVINSINKRVDFAKKIVINLKDILRQIGFHFF